MHSFRRSTETLSASDITSSIRNVSYVFSVTLTLTCIQSADAFILTFCAALPATLGQNHLLNNEAAADIITMSAYTQESLRLRRIAGEIKCWAKRPLDHILALQDSE